VVTAKDPPSEHTDQPAADDSIITASELLGLTVEHPAHDVCVVTVNGELDMVTTPLLEACLRNQLRTSPRHLVVDLQQVQFLSSSGLNCLLSIRDSALTTTTTQLHLAGLVSRPVARVLQVSQLMDRFNTYPTVTDAVTAIID
jgi:anti-anti-sigma factor